jgi:hypothetical protein
MEFVHPIQLIPVVLKANLPKISWWSRFKAEIEMLEQHE